MRLQEVLKEREAEITALEGTLRERERAPVPHIETNGATVNGNLPNGNLPHVNGHANGFAAPHEDAAALMHLSPKTRSQFQELRRSLDMPPTSSDDGDDIGESLDRLNELMRYIFTI